MAVIQCPHCQKDVEFDDDAVGEYSCPHCDGILNMGESKGYSFATKAGVVAILLLVVILIDSIPTDRISFGGPDTSSWPLEEVEIIEITNEGRTVVNEDAYYSVEIRFLYEGDERVWNLKCDNERDAEAYTEDNPVGSIIDIRVNPVKGESPFFDIEGGCPAQPWEFPKESVYGGAICFGLVIAVFGIGKIRELIRTKKYE